MNTNSRLKIPAAGRNIRPVRFALIFFCCFVLGIAVLLIPPVQRVDLQFTQGLVVLSHKIITVCGGHATQQGAILRSPRGFAVEMRDGCNALNVTILLCSAVFAFPATWKMKLLGILAARVRTPFTAAGRAGSRNRPSRDGDVVLAGDQR